MRVYSITDVHGMKELLVKALKMIEEREEQANVVFKGDYVDRGPDSKGVVDILMQGPRRKGDRWKVLKGNHEDMVVGVMEGRYPMRWWLDNGGDKALSSWGGNVPEDVVEWMSGLPLMWVEGEYAFVHAGVMPGVALHHQKKGVMLWVRDEFLGWDGDFGKHIVHGHTPVSRADLRSNRTNLDTGAPWTGVLSVGVFETDRKGGPIEVIEIRE
jgi:serine/threonine protein phosphatase 1